MLLDETKHVEPGLINIGCRGGGGSLIMCDIQDVVRKITLFLIFSTLFVQDCRFRVTQVNIVFDFLAGYNKQLVIDLDKIGIKDESNLLDNARNG